MHAIGCTHNDLKPENIVLGNDQYPIKLIDFGLASSFVDEKGVHIKEQDCLFSGNPIFCSRNTIIQKTPSRRDDLESLAYLLVYLHQGHLWFFQDDPELETVEYIAMQKQIGTPEMICGEFSKVLLGFVTRIFALEYSEEPNYQELINLLLNVLKDNNLEFTGVFDWTEIATSEINESVY